MVELGCGLGIPAMTAYRLGAKSVLMTDRAIAVPYLLEQLELNGLSKNGITAEELNWGSEDSARYISSTLIKLFSKK